MVKIKIISNPYQKVTVFQNWDEGTQQWRTIDAEHDGDSKLLCDELSVGFFPFKAKQIIDVIVSEYSVVGEKVEVVFEGTDDEYLELESICSQDDYPATIVLTKSSRYLENARDILPDVIDVFKELSPLVAESVSDKEKIKRELEKFSDASNDVIPICVIGNYSSGKSTFINALIGYELLPSSDEPTTAKIYKISQSKHPDRATIKFEYGFKSVRIRFSADSYKFLTDPEDNPLTKKLKDMLDEITAEPIPSKLNKVLEVINSFANRERDESISDLIEIEAPFDDDGIWGKMWNNFVIFDTPGSNSASNVKHYQVLKKAMEDLSNGLPIFVSEYDSLDSTDNDKLYQDINNMAELDNRFTMIIVNKADAASLKKTGLTDDDRDRILSLAIPRKLYSGGLYFVSSIMGLGSKNDEEFIADHNAEVFSQIVTNSTALSDEKRSQLSGIILEYQELVFDTRAEAIFDKAAFLHRFFGDANRLNIDKLTRKYNSEMQVQVLEIYHSFEGSQTIEKLLDGIVPDKRSKEYIIVLLATPIRDIEYRKLSLAEMYSGLAPYAAWSTTFTYNEQNSTGSSATVGVNIGASAGIQNGQNNAVTNSNGTTDSSSDTVTDSTSEGTTESTGETVTDSTGQSVTDSTGSSVTNTTGNAESSGTTHTDGSSTSQTDTSGSSDSTGGSAGANFGVQATANYNHTWNSYSATGTGTNVSDAVSEGVTKSVSESVAQSTGQAIAKSTGQAIAKATGTAVTSTVGRAVAKTLGQAVTNSVSRTAGAFKSVNFGANFGASFARTSNVTATIGKSEGINQSFTNYNIKHALEILEAQMKRLELSTALGMWDFAAYVMSEDQNVANNVAHSYLALTQGEESYMSQAAINLWRGDMGESSGDAKEICNYLRELRHPLFGLNPNITAENPDFNVYPPIVTATTNLSGKELAYSLNFPKKSISGLPVIECAEFGRNVVSYDLTPASQDQIELGKVFHMNHEENAKVHLAKESLASHTFITGSTGSGKSNTVYQILNEALEQDVRFMVVEPAKGEYKHIFGSDPDVFVYGTNPAVSPVLRINPFSFPKEIHVSAPRPRSARPR